MRKPAPGLWKKANGTHQPFDGDGPRDPSSGQRGGPTAAFYPNPSVVHGCSVWTGRADSRVSSGGATGSLANQTTWRWAQSTRQSIAASSPSWTANLVRVGFYRRVGRRWLVERHHVGRLNTRGDSRGCPPWVHFFCIGPQVLARGGDWWTPED